MLHEKNFTTQSIVAPKLHHAKYHYAKILQQKISPYYAFSAFYKELALHAKNAAFWAALNNFSFYLTLIFYLALISFYLSWIKSAKLRGKLT